MITGFVGTPGSGKSYEAVLKLLDNIKLGRKIYTNIEGLERPECKEAIKIYCNITDFQLETCLNHLDNDQSMEFWNHCENGSLILIDEVHKLFSNRDWASEKNKEFTEWASTHRHQGFDVVLITQDLEKIDKHARSLIEWTYLFRKINFLGSLVQQKYLCYAYQGDNHSGQPIGKSTKTYSQKVFACYSSYDSSEVKEMGFMKHVNILRHPVFYSIPVVIILFVFMASKSGILKGEIFGTTEASATITENKKLDNEKNELVPDKKKSIQISKNDSSTSISDETLHEKVIEKDIVKAYRNSDGRIIWTNNGYQPPKTRYVRTLLYNN